MEEFIILALVADVTCRYFEHNVLCGDWDWENFVQYVNNHVPFPSLRTDIFNIIGLLENHGVFKELLKSLSKLDIYTE